MNSQPPPAMASVERSELRADLRVVTTVSRPGDPESTHASFVVEHGQPGARRVA